MQLASLDFEAAFDSPHRGRLLNALPADGVPGMFVRLLGDMNQRTTAAVRTPAECTTPFAPSGRPFTELEYANDVVIFAESSTKLHHVVNLVSKLAAAYGLGLRPDKCKQMRPADRLVQRVLRSSPGSSWKKPPGRKRKFWSEVVKEDLRTLGVDRQFRRDKIEKVGQSGVQGRHTSEKMRVVASGDDINPPIQSRINRLKPVPPKNHGAMPSKQAEMFRFKIRTRNIRINGFSVPA
ncbi:hypothetical protein RB195_006151 [Necator americanus]|uniref:Reverse transcriptase domain-containing protein n=1 Tax=Necator americanus TaxID=51031 RepID=A0ABR1BUK2_NECAM